MELSKPQRMFQVTRTAPTQKMTAPKPARYSNASACEVTMQIGIFFDGTGNNVEADKGVKGHSNIARLFEAYEDVSEVGSYAIYVPGLGTPFPLVGEDTETTLGGAFAKGGDSRIVFALLRVFDAIHTTLFRTEMFNKNLRQALCTLDLSNADQRHLRKVGLLNSLVENDGRNRTGQYLTICANSIRAKIQEKVTPKICDCALDIFGFSRGATEARVFCHWLNDLLSVSGLAGIPLRLRFLGLMDTVASVGILEGIKNDQLGRDGGHSLWAMPEVMRILPTVENCVHLVSMHELRKNFPLDTVRFNQELPSNCVEFVYPGSHSDVGGGYKPGELGVSADDSLKLSQIPLNHMYDCAIAAGVPLSKERLGDKTAFDVNKELATAMQRFIDISTEQPRSLGDWMLPYLVWRWQTRLSYSNTGQATRANTEDRRYLLAGNQQFCWGDDQIRAYVLSKKQPNRLPYNRDKSIVTLLTLEAEAPQLRDRIVAFPKIEPELATFFDRFVHDSMAGFRKKLVEKCGMWRYRRVFYGSEIPYIG